MGRRLRTLHAESGVLGVGISDADVSTLLAGWLQVWQCPRPLATRGTGRSGSPPPHAADAEQASRRTAMNKSNRSGRDFGWEIAHAAVSRRPPIFLHTMVPRTGGYAYDDGVWDLSIIQGAIFCRAVPYLSDSRLFHRGIHHHAAAECGHVPGARSTAETRH